MPSGLPHFLVAPRTFRLAAGVYLAGLVVWLVLGLLPSLSGAIGPLHDGLADLARGHGRLATYAGRVAADDMASASLAWVAVNYLFSALNLALGVVLVARRPDEPVARLLALAVMGTAATFNEPSHEVFHLLDSPPAVKAVHFTFHVVSGTAYLWAVALFPDGALPVAAHSARRVRTLVGAAVTAAVVLVCWRSSFIAHPPFFVVFFGVLVPVVGITAQTLRLHSAATVGRHRVADQARLLRTALLPALGVALVWSAGHVLELPAGHGEVGLRLVQSAQVVFPAVFALVPVVMFVAIVRYGLLDIDVLVSRTLLIAVLVTSVTLVYVAAVAVTGLLVAGHGWSVVVPLLVVACVAEPIRQRSQALCNRLVFGQELSPRDAVRSLVDGFSGVGDADGLAELVRVVVQSSRASSATLWLTGPHEHVVLARYPSGSSGPTVLEAAGSGLEGCRALLAPATCWPVAYQGELLAVLAVTTPRGVTLTRREHRLLDDLSHHAGLLVANARLTVDLAQELEVVQAQAVELQHSRQDVVAAQDRRRRRLERDIHDGAQQQLVVLLILLRALARHPDPTGLPAARVEEIRSTLAAASETLSRLSSGHAPLVLVQRGLEAALRDAAGAAGSLGPEVQVRIDLLRPVDAEREAAVYFCCLEALQNAVKHAAATHVDVLVTSDADHVELAVADDGRGFDRAVTSDGSGLADLGSRLVLLGGRVDVVSEPGRGTTVSGVLPLPEVERSAPSRVRPVGAPS
jgi:signal transduction histidine kinase